MAAHVKSVDEPHAHLVGSVGFYGAASPSRAGTTQLPVARRRWALISPATSPCENWIACVHIWADLWLYTGESDKLEFLDRGITGHLEEARDTFDKPVILEEFGKWRPLGVRDVFFERAFAGAVAGPASNVPSHARPVRCSGTPTRTGTCMMRTGSAFAFRLIRAPRRWSPPPLIPFGEALE